MAVKIRTAVRYKASLNNKPFHECTRLNEASGCIEWIGSLYPTGYGRCLAVVGEPETPRAHRRSWEIKNGEIPSGMDVLHRCDNPRCVNTDHLYLGDDLQNMADKMARKRNINLAGAEHGKAILSPEDVVRIREASLFGAARADLARAYGVTEGAVLSVVKRKSWKHI